MELIHSIQTRFSFKAFGLGILGVLAVYAGLFGYTSLQADKTLETLQARLATQTVLIEHPGHSDMIAAQDHLESQDRVKAPEGAHHAKGHSGKAHDQATESTLEDLVGKPSKALREAPVDGVFEDSAYGRLPVALSETQTPFSIYRRPFLLNQGRKFIAVIIADFGLSSSLSDMMIENLPADVSFILSPYSQEPEKWTQAARQEGHEIWLNLPMENENFPLEDPGAKGLLTRVSIQYNHERLQWLLGRTTGYAGVAVYSDRALENAGSMFNNIAHDLFKRGLGYLELNTQTQSYFKDMAEDLYVPRITAQHTLDFVDVQSVKQQAVVNQIQDIGGSVVVVRPSPNNISALKKWLATLQDEGVQIVPVSALALANAHVE